MNSAKCWMKVWLAAALAAVLTFPASARTGRKMHHGRDRTWNYRLQDGTATVTGANQTTGSLSIPSSLDGYPVTRIGDGAFEYCSNLTSLTISGTVTNIGDWAFNFCKGLTRISIPNSVTSIGRRAFSSCRSLTTVTIPESVAFIGDGAFAWCDELIKFTVVKDNMHYASVDGVLFTKSGDTLLCCPPSGKSGAYSIPSGVTSIGYLAFSCCDNLTSVTIPASVTNIEEHAFNACYMSKVTIPDSVTHIGSCAFSQCGGLASVTIPNSVTNIEEGVFWNCAGLCSVTIPDTVTSIGIDAFSICPMLASVTIPDKVTSIGEGAFRWCRSLVTMTIPAGVKSIGKDAFEGCSGLETLYVPESWESKYENGVFWSDYAWVPAGCEIVYYGPELALATSSQGFTAAAANNQKLGVTANVPWTATSSVAWLTVRTASGSGNGTITYNVDANGSTAARTGTITVEGGGITRVFTVTQGAGDPVLVLASSSQSFTAAAENNRELGVTANVSWTAQSSASWLTVKTASGSGDGTILYNVAANPGTASRTGTITVTGGGITRTFTVTQGGAEPVLSLAADSQSFTASAANSQQLGVIANVDWTATSSASWLTVRTASGSGNGTIVYDLSANGVTAARTGTITLTGGGLTRTFTVTQGGAAPALTLAAESRSFTSDAANGQELGVTANVSWTAQSSSSWLTVRTASGSGSGTITYNVAANTARSARTGTITVTGGGITRTFTVTQDGFVERLALAAESRNFTSDAANGQELGVTANVAWTAGPSVTWLTVQTASGSGNGTILYNVAANKARESRTGTITVAGGGLTRTFTVTQDGKEPPAPGQPQTLTLDGNGGWSGFDIYTIGGPYTFLPNSTWEDGVVFTGWYTQPDGGEQVTASDIVTAEEERTIYAHWKLLPTSECPVAVPCEWLDAHGLDRDSVRGYQEAAVSLAANGMRVWECYVAGLDPTAAGAAFQGKSALGGGGGPEGEWYPDLNEGGTKAARRYVVEGKQSAEDEWGEQTTQSQFFRVKVRMPEGE